MRWWPLFLCHLILKIWTMWEVATRRQLSNFSSSCRFRDLLLTTFIFAKKYSQMKLLPLRLVVRPTWSLSIESLPPGKQCLQKPRSRTFRNECHCRSIDCIWNSTEILSALPSDGIENKSIVSSRLRDIGNETWILLSISELYFSQNWQVCRSWWQLHFPKSKLPFKAKRKF
jgi:hypothetical protein